MAIDSVNNLRKKKTNLDKKEISDCLATNLKHITDSGLDVEDIKSKFIFLRTYPPIIVPIPVLP